MGEAAHDLAEETVAEGNGIAWAASAPLDLSVGAQVDRYVLLDRLGAGGMGEVYAAYDADLDRKVALKILRPDKRDDAAIASRIVLEGRAMARIHHPNVLGIYDVGTVGDAIFLAIELVEGETLAEWTARKPRGWREIVRAYRMAGAGLAAAHQEGVVHRDFKPGNTLVDRAGRVRVIDFGLARLAAGCSRDDDGVGWATSEPQITAPGTVMGTPIYMAPEQLRGEPATAASDQFSYCVALYRALYGRLPFESEAFVEPPLGEVPPAVVAVLRRGLARTAAERWPSMETLVDALSVAARSGDRLWETPEYRLPVAFVALAAFIASPMVWPYSNRWAWGTPLGVPIATFGELVLVLLLRPLMRTLGVPAKRETLLLSLLVLDVGAKIVANALLVAGGASVDFAQSTHLAVRAAFTLLAVVAIEPRLWPSSAVFLSSFLVAARWPSARFALLSASDAALLANAAVAWRVSKVRVGTHAEAALARGA